MVDIAPGKSPGTGPTIGIRMTLRAQELKRTVSGCCDLGQGSTPEMHEPPHWCVCGVMQY
jgi:hypothetical protein